MTGLSRRVFLKALGAGLLVIAAGLQARSSRVLPAGPRAGQPEFADGWLLRSSDR